VTKKYCPKCKIEQQKTDFHKTTKTKSGIQSWCKYCQSAYCNDRYKQNPTRYLDSKRNKKYGLLSTQYKEMLKSQKELCKICLKPETMIQQGTLKSLSVDHDHTTRKIRGLLCIRCNSGLGHFNDDPKLLRYAATYIEKGRNKK
jgi:hypothetical protein